MPSENALWHPFGAMESVPGNEFVVSRADGVWVWDQHGRRYLDGSASLWYCNAGHGRAEIVEAISKQMRTLDAYHTFGNFANQPALQLADRLASIAPLPGAKIFLTSGGGDSIDTAAKLARLHHAIAGEPSRLHLISREHGYHGTHGIATSILGMPYREGFGPLVRETSRVPYDSVAALEAEIERIGPENIAAFVVEPVIAGGGVYPPPADYIAGIQETCARHGILTVADAVVCGFGRLGAWFGVERFDWTPDLIVFAKGVTSGYLPLGGVVVSARVAEQFWVRDDIAFDHGATYSGHPACCAAALANIELLERDGLVNRAQEIEDDFYRRLQALESHPIVGEVRGGIGLMAAVAIEPERVESDPALPSRLLVAAREAGLITRGLRDGVAIAPPLIIETAEMDTAVTALGDALDAIVRARSNTPIFG